MPTLHINLKSLFLSMWSVILFIPLLVIGIFILIVSEMNIGNFANSVSNLSIYPCVIAPILAVTLAHKENELEYSLYQKYQISFYKIISTFLFCLSSFLIYIVLFIISWIITPVSFYLLLNYIVYHFIVLFVAVLFMSTVGFAIGRAIRKNFAYVIVFLLSIIMSPFFQNIVGGSARDLEDPSIICAFLNLLNLTYDEPFRIHFLSYGMPINENLFWTVAFYIAFSLLLFFLMAFIIENTRKLKLVSVSVCVISILAGVFSFFGVLQTSPIVFELFESDEYTLQPSEKIDNQAVIEENTNWDIKSYHMDLKLKSNLQNVCLIQLENQSMEENQIIKLKLDSCFNINRLLINGVDVPYEQEGDWLTLTPTEKSITIELDYQGRINYADELLQKTVFCEDFSCYLPELFAWYPKLQNNQESIPFSLRVDSWNPVVSNIQIENNNEKLKTFSGNTRDVFLFSGFIDTLHYQDQTIVLPQASSLLYDRNFSKLQGILDFINEPNSILNFPFSFNVTEDMFVDKQFQTYYFIPYSYNSVAGLPYAVDDICIINEYLSTLNLSN